MDYIDHQMTNRRTAGINDCSWIVHAIRLPICNRGTQTMRRLHLLWVATLLLAACVQVQRPGPLPDGKTLLPNNWRLSPAGKQIPVGDLPLGMAVTPDGKWLYVTNNGYSKQYVSVIDLQAQKEIARIPMRQSWLGLQ